MYYVVKHGPDEYLTDNGTWAYGRKAARKFPNEIQALHKIEDLERRFHDRVFYVEEVRDAKPVAG